MADLVTLSQVLAELRLDTTVENIDDAERIQQLIPMVSDAIRDYTGLALAASDYTEVFDGGCQSFYLMNRPINSVASVKDLNDSPATTVDPTTYGVDNLAGLVFPKANATDAGWARGFSNENPVWDVGRQRWQVIYNAGGATIPARIQMACIRWISALRQITPGLQSERIGDYSYTREQMADGMPTEVKLILDSAKGSRIRI